MEIEMGMELLLGMELRQHRTEEEDEVISTDIIKKTSIAVGRRS